MRRWTSMAAGLTVGVLLSVVLYVTAAPAGTGGPVRIGVLDFRGLLEKYEKMQDTGKEILTMQRTLREQGQAKTEVIQQLRARLNMHTPGSEAYKDTESEITTKTVELEMWAKSLTRTVLERESTAIKEICADMTRATTAYARRNGLTLVLKSDRLELIGNSVSELDFRVTLKKVLYHSESLDITEHVVAALNQEYRKQKALNGGTR